MSFCSTNQPLDSHEDEIIALDGGLYLPWPTWATQKVVVSHMESRQYNHFRCHGCFYQQNFPDVNATFLDQKPSN